MPPKKSTLPTKERTLFTTLLQQYETKKHKAGIKTADQILKRFPEHGETLCMKGLLLASMDRREEGLELAKKGVRLDLTSFICWHALGILNRIDRNYPEAIKCYGQALRIDKDNLNLLRESAFLYMHERNYGPLIDCRLSLLRMQPHVRYNWVGLAVAHHVAGSLDEALRVLKEYESTMRDVPRKSYEHSEVLLYRASIMEEKKDYAEAVDYLNSKEDEIVDVKALQEIKARCLAAAGKKDEAEAIWRKLISQNSENKLYYAGLLSVRGIDLNPTSEEVRADAVKVFSGLQEEYPRATAPKRLALVYATGDDFRNQASAYIRGALQKGIPSLFVDLKSLYRDDNKRQTVEQIVEGCRTEWAPRTEEETAEPPSSYLWVLYYLAQHYSQLGHHSQALHYINSAIAHSPTMPELLMTKARVLKRGGDLRGAADAMQDGRALDGQDRFLNSKAAKYALRVNDTEEAVRVVGLFTKPDAPDPVFDLNEMQALWYLSEEADAYTRKGNFGMALKRLHQIDKIFTEIYDDQLDFHSYCLRKFTMLSYVSTIRFEDQLRSHPAYFRAALAAVRLYTRLFDKPASQGPAIPGAESMTEDERKKAAKKAKKAELRAAEEAKKAEAAKAKVEEPKKPAGDEDAPVPPKDDDPDGSKLLNTKTPLEDALKFVQVLQQRADKRIETWFATFEIAIRQKNWLAALRALTHAHKLDKSHPELHPLVTRFKATLPRVDTLPEIQQSAINDGLAAVLAPGQPLGAYNAEFLQGHPGSAPHILGAAKGMLDVRGEAGKSDVAELVLQLTREENHASLATLLDAQVFLRETVLLHLEDFNAAASKLYPMANAFKAPEVLEEEAKKRAEERAAWEAAKEGEPAANEP